MVGVLRPLQAALDHGLDRVRRPVDQEVQLLALDRGEVGQDIVGRVLPAGRPTRTGLRSTKALRGDRGAVTVEAAIALCTLTLVTALAVGAIAATSARRSSTPSSSRASNDS